MNSFGGGMGGMGGAGFGGGGGRIASKASKIYDNRKRDLVDAAEADEGSIAKLEKNKLPAEMQKMNLEERKKFIAQKAKERKQIQEEIKKVAKEREAHLSKELAKLGNAKDTFGDAICEAVDVQLAKKGFGKSEK